MQHLRMKLGGLAVAGATAALALTGGPALASVHHTSKSITGPEVISGVAHGKKVIDSNAPKVPLTLRGLVSGHSVVVLGNSKSKTHTLKTTTGNLVVKQTGPKQSSQTVNKTTCRLTFTQDITISVLGSESTGAFAGTSGPGAVRITFTGVEPKFTSGPHKGQCNVNAQPLNKGAAATFLASIVLTTP